MTSDKYPGWVIEKNGRYGYTMFRPDWEAKDVFYAIAVSKDSSGWFGELCTRRNDRYSDQGWSWEPARKQYYGDVPKVVKEAERRAAYWLSRS